MEATRPTLSLLAFLGPPIAWAIHVMVVYPLVPWICSTGHFWLFWLAHLAAIGAAAAATLVGWRIHHHTARDGDAATGRAHFLARLGVWAGIFFVFAIALESLPTLLLDPCR
ncbi:hypothetical protein [Vulgatibacter sp.]|uniref:hypothetical protein n=1 Tax=Vulgatibacter sp. TaxID=1971226 RepID=UPI00356225AC